MNEGRPPGGIRVPAADIVHENQAVGAEPEGVAGAVGGDGAIARPVRGTDGLDRACAAVRLDGAGKGPARGEKGTLARAEEVAAFGAHAIRSVARSQ